MFCPACGSEVSSTAQFCLSCGRSLADAAPPPPPASAPEAPGWGPPAAPAPGWAPPPAPKRRRGGLIAGIIIGLIVLLLVGLGVAVVATRENYKGTKPLAWASTVCGAVADANDANVGREKELETRLAPGGFSPLQVRDIEAAFFADLLRNTDDMIAKVDRVGQPAADGGARTQQELLASLRSSRADLDRFRGELVALPVSNPDQFKKSLEDLGTRMEASADSSGKAAQSIHDFKVPVATKRAIDRDANCKRMDANG